MPAVPLELLGEPVASGHVAALFLVVMTGTRIGSVECDMVAGRSSPSHRGGSARVLFMNDRPAFPRLDVRNRVAGWLLRLLNPIAISIDNRRWIC